MDSHFECSVLWGVAHLVRFDLSLVFRQDESYNAGIKLMR